MRAGDRQATIDIDSPPRRRRSAVEFHRHDPIATKAPLPCPSKLESPMRDVTPRSLAPISILLPMLLVACGQGDTESAADAAGDPVEHYTSLNSRLENGEVEEAYAEFLPPSYEADVETVFSKIRALITAVEYEKIHRILSTFAEKIRPILVGSLGAERKELEELVTELDDLPAALGMESHAAFQQLTARELTSRLGSGFVRHLLTAPEFRRWLGKPSVRAPKIGRHYAVLEIAAQNTTGEESATTFEVVPVDGHWVPSTLARSWKKNIREMVEGLDRQLEAKEQKPEMLLAQLDLIEKQVQGVVPLLGGLIEMARRKRDGKPGDVLGD